mmetsp:Transcript_21635/g.45735  ORF Transcript_21635/g.45735 Transcript_21635/m.45735 type:complete len:184 (-) Transcript_21635:211-762(-)
MSDPKSNRTTPSKMSNNDWRLITRDAYAALFDMVGDWGYLYAIYNRDFDGDGEADEENLERVPFDYNIITSVVFVFCILSTIFGLWQISTSVGRKCGKNSLCCKCSVPRLALASILMEDLPQFILTAYIDMKLGGEITPAGMLNICSSLTALVNRATTRYDEIEDENENNNGANLDTVYEKMT